MLPDAVPSYALSLTAIPGACQHCQQRQTMQRLPSVGIGAHSYDDVVDKPRTPQTGSYKEYNCVAG